MTTLDAQFDSPGRPVWTVSGPRVGLTGAVCPEATLRDVLLAFGSSVAVLWIFGAYEIARNIRNGVSFTLGTAFLSRWSTPLCITCTVAVFAGVILLRA
jgi:hypothetical protein